MKYLVIETSGHNSFVALLEEGHQNQVIYLNSKKKESTELLPTIEQLFSKNMLSVSDLGCIAVGIGPGLFTATRIGSITAKAFAFAHTIPLFPFCSLQGYLPRKMGEFMTIANAKQNSVYAIEGCKLEDRVVYTKRPTTIPIDRCSSYPGVVTTPNIDPIKDKWPCLQHEKLLHTPMDFAYLAQFCKDSLHRKAPSIHQVAPIYL